MVAAVALFPAGGASSRVAEPRDDYSAQAIHSVYVSTGETRKLVEDGFNYAPTFSPDGGRIAFACSRGSGFLPSELCTMRPDGSDRRRLTDFPDTVLEEPVSSPNGSKIAFWAFRPCAGREWSECGRYQAYAIDAGGGRLVELGVNTRSPSWAPDSGRLVVAARIGRGGKPHELRIVRSNGAVRRRIVEGDGVWDPEWSPSGGSILYSAGDADYRHVQLENLSTGKKRQFRLGREASWAPNGRRFAFRRGTTLFVESLEGSVLRRISGCWGGISWSPSGRSVAFFGEPIGPIGRMSVLTAPTDYAGVRRLAAQAKYEPDSLAPPHPAWAFDEESLVYAAYDST